MTFIKLTIKSNINLIIVKPIIETEKPTKLILNPYKKDDFILNMY